MANTEYSIYLGENGGRAAYQTALAWGEECWDYLLHEAEVPEVGDEDSGCGLGPKPTEPLNVNLEELVADRDEAGFIALWNALSSADREELAAAWAQTDEEFYGDKESESDDEEEELRAALEGVAPTVVECCWKNPDGSDKGTSCCRKSTCVGSYTAKQLEVIWRIQKGE